MFQYFILLRTSNLDLMQKQADFLFLLVPQGTACSVFWQRNTKSGIDPNAKIKNSR